MRIEGTGGGASQRKTQPRRVSGQRRRDSSSRTAPEPQRRFTVHGCSAAHLSGSGGNNYGVHASAAIPKSPPAGGAVLVEGTGGGAGNFSAANHGVNVTSGAAITKPGCRQRAPTSPSVRLWRYNPTGTGNSNYGVYVAGADCPDHFHRLAVTVEGYRRAYAPAAAVTITVWVDGAGAIVGTGTGTDATVTIKGYGGALTGDPSESLFGFHHACTYVAPLPDRGGGAVL
jgi:hypothetical protein